MKRTYHIIISMMLSAMIVLLGVGVSFVDCCHAQRTSMAMAATDYCEPEGCCGDCHSDNKGDDCGCKPQTSCLKVTVAKLAPFSDAAHHAFCFACPMVALPHGAWLRPQALLAVAAPKATPTAAPTLGASPPRSRLLLLRVLLL